MPMILPIAYAISMVVVSFLVGMYVSKGEKDRSILAATWAVVGLFTFICGIIICLALSVDM